MMRSKRSLNWLSCWTLGLKKRRFAQYVAINRLRRAGQSEHRDFVELKALKNMAAVIKYFKQRPK